MHLAQKGDATVVRRWRSMIQKKIAKRMQTQAAKKVILQRPVKHEEILEQRKNEAKLLRRVKGTASEFRRAEMEKKLQSTERNE